MRIENSICRVYSPRIDSQVPTDMAQSVNPCIREQCDKYHRVSPIHRVCVCNHDCNPCSESVGRKE